MASRLLFLPHPTPETSRKEKLINTIEEQKESLETINSTEENKNERKIRKICQEDEGNVRKIRRKIEERRRNQDYYLKVPGPEARHTKVPAHRGGPRTLGLSSSSSSSSSGGRSGASLMSIGKNSGDEGALGQGVLKGGEFLPNGTLYGGDSCQTVAAYNCAAAVPPISNLGLRKTTNLGSGQKIKQKARNENCGTPRGITDI
jgi:hypothetical protein